MKSFDQLCVTMSKMLKHENKNKKYPTDHKLLKVLLKDLLSVNDYNSIEELEFGIEPDRTYVTPKGFEVSGQTVLVGTRLAKSDMSVSPLPMKSKEKIKQKNSVN